MSEFRVKPFEQVKTMDPKNWNVVGGRFLCSRYPEIDTINGIVLPKRSRQNPCGLAWIVSYSGAGGYAPGDTIFTWERTMDQCALEGIGEPYTCPCCKGLKFVEQPSPVEGAPPRHLQCARCEGTGLVSDRYFVLDKETEIVLWFPAGEYVVGPTTKILPAGQLDAEPRLKDFPTAHRIS